MLSQLYRLVRVEITWVSNFLWIRRSQFLGLQKFSVFLWAATSSFNFWGPHELRRPIYVHIKISENLRFILQLVDQLIHTVHLESKMIGQQIERQVLVLWVGQMSLLEVNHPYLGDSHWPNFTLTPPARAGGSSTFRTWCNKQAILGARNHQFFQLKTC